MNEEAKRAVRLEEAEEIARRLKNIPAGKLRVWLDFVQVWSGLSDKGKRSFMNVLQMAINTHRETDTGGDCPPLPRFPTKEQLFDVCRWEIDRGRNLPPGRVESFTTYRIVVLKQAKQILGDKEWER